MFPFQYILDRFHRNKEFSLPHPTIYALSFHKGICKEFPYDFTEDISTWVQQLCPCSLFEHFQNEGVFKGLHIDNPFHDDRGPFVEVIVGQVCLIALEMFWVRAWMLWWLLGGRMLSRRYLQKQSEDTKRQVQKHKNKNTNLISTKLVYKTNTKS